MTNVHFHVPHDENASDEDIKKLEKGAIDFIEKNGAAIGAFSESLQKFMQEQNPTKLVAFYVLANLLARTNIMINKSTPIEFGAYMCQLQIMIESSIEADKKQTAPSSSSVH